MSDVKTLEDRVEEANAAICVHHSGDNEDDAVDFADLLRDFRHWCDSHDVDFDVAVHVSESRHSGDCEEELKAQIREEGKASSLLTVIRLLRKKLTAFFDESDALWNDWAPAYLVDKVIEVAEASAKKAEKVEVSNVDGSFPQAPWLAVSVPASCPRCGGGCYDIECVVLEELAANVAVTVRCRNTSCCGFVAGPFLLP